MIVISIVCIVSSFIAFESAFTVLRLDRRKNINIVYAMFTFEYALMCILFNQFVTAPEREIAWIWNRIMIVPVTLNSSLLFHFSLLLGSKSRTVKNPLLLTVVYIPACIMSFLWFSRRVLSDIHITPWGWDNSIEIKTGWANFAILVPIILFFLSFGVVLFRFLRTKNESVKKQLRPIIFALLSGFIGWGITNIGIVIQEPILYTLIGNISVFLFVTPLILGVRWSIAKHNLMTLSPDRPAAELISGMNEPVFLLDMGGKIIFQNKPADILLERSGCTDEYSVQDLFLHSAGMKKELDAIAGGKSRGEYVNVTFKDIEDNRTAYLLKLHGIKNEAREHIGVMCIASEEFSLKEFQKRYGITNRELDVLYLSVSGLSNREIAEKLEISERTVEHHHYNIYNKLGIDNKIELYNIALKYRLISN